MKKKFRLIDAILSVICVVFVAEAAAPVAAIGNSQFFWWILLMITFLLPYGLISSEFGSTYQGDGGLYDWVAKAYGKRWGGRVAWYYWINFPLWMASLAVMIPEILSIVTGTEFGMMSSVIMELFFVWGIVLISFFPVCNSGWILNGCAAVKVFLALLIGVLGVYVAATQGVANEYTVASLLPSFDLDSLSYISVIIFNFLGFEVICSFADSMEKPQKQIPQAIIAGGLVIMLIYIFSAFGIGVAIPTNEISTSTGLLDAFVLLTGSNHGVFLSIMAFLFMITLVGNMVSWSYGVNDVAFYAANNGDLPKVFQKKSQKNEMPVGSAVMNGIVASVVIIIAPFIPNQDLFWCFFALNLVMFLLSYLPMFPAFLKLRKTEPDTVRPFRVPGGKLLLHVIAYAPMLMIVIALIFVAVPLSFDSETLESVLPITIGAVICIGIGEVIVRCKRDTSEKRSS